MEPVWLAAIKSAELGFRVAIIEKGIIGGTCVNIGCIPSKTLIKMAKTKHIFEKQPFSAITAKSISFSWPKVLQQKDNLVNKLRKSKYKEVITSNENIILLRGTANFIDKQTIAVAGRKITAENALTNSNKVLDLTVLPQVIFTEPQVATVGVTEQKALEQGMSIETTTLPMEYVPQALAAHNTKGFIKLLREKDSGKLVGAHILAENAGELISLATILIAHSKKKSIPTEEIAEEFFPYLTQMEGLKLALLTFSKDLAKLSYCATYKVINQTK
ncbi:MAG: FAD-dependent oxidoreductase [Candidatus Heimdallarchaeota archaeon]